MGERDDDDELYLNPCYRGMAAAPSIYWENRSRTSPAVLGSKQNVVYADEGDCSEWLVESERKVT